MPNAGLPNQCVVSGLLAPSISVEGEMVAKRDLVIAGATVLTDSDAAPELKDIVIRDGKIAAIASSGEKYEQHGVVVDGRHRLVIPGLINAHYHSHDVLS